MNDKVIVAEWDKRDGSHNRFKRVKYIIDDNGCHVICSHKHNGKGRVRLVINGKHIMSYRYAYEMTKGKIPEGMLVCHKCDNPLCVNPDHLFLGTHDDNMKDMASKGRGRTNPRMGSKSNFAKLTEEDVIYIKKHLDIPNKILAKKFGVKSEQIRRIKKGERWKHIIV